jgi:hypothetical protein
MKLYRVELIEKRIYVEFVSAPDKKSAIAYFLSYPHEAEEPDPPEIEKITAILVEDEW